MKQFTLIYLIAFLVLVLIAFAASADEDQALCVTEMRMAESIQFVRITSHDDFATYKQKVGKWSKPGKSLGYEMNPDEIAVKDAFWQKNIEMADFIYRFYPVGFAPDYVGKQILILCTMKSEVRRKSVDKTIRFML